MRILCTAFSDYLIADNGGMHQIQWCISAHTGRPGLVAGRGILGFCWEQHYRVRGGSGGARGAGGRILLTPGRQSAGNWGGR